MSGTHQYHYLVAGLPDLNYDGLNATIGQAHFLETLKAQCDPSDVELFNWLFYPQDISRLVQLLMQRPITEPSGSFSADELNAIIRYEMEAPSFIAQFLEQFEADRTAYDEDGWKNVVIALFYENVNGLQNTFLKDWLLFERNLKNLIVAFNARKYEDKPERSLIIGNEFANQLISQSSKRDFGLMHDAVPAPKVINILEGKNIVHKEKQLDDLRWQWLDEHTFFHYFSVERLLAYYIKLGIVERWQKLDKAHGQTLLDQMIEKFAHEVQLTETDKPQPTYQKTA